MLTLVFMKIAADLALYYTFAGFFAALFGASGGILLLVLVMQTAVFTLSYAARGFGWRRFLPLMLLALCWLVPGAGLADRIIIAPPALYMIYLAYKGIYEPDWSQQTMIFSIFWKALLAFSALCILCGTVELVKSVVLPFGVITLLCSVLLMRSLRHEPQVYCQTKYQLVNVLLVCAVGLCVLFLSSDVFLGACIGALKVIYRWVIKPVLSVFLYIFILIVRAVVWLISFIKLKEAEPEENTLNLNDLSAQEILKIDETATSNALIGRIVAGIGILAATAVIILVFRALAKRRAPQKSEREMGEVRTYNAQKRERPDDTPAGSPAARVRAQYRRFLKFISSQSLRPEKSDTSLDISRKCSGLLDEDAVNELRDIYIEARYDGKAGREDAQRAKELYTEIKRSSDH